MSKKDINSAMYNAEKMFEEKIKMYDENKKNRGLLVFKEYFGIISECLLIIKCKLLKSSILKAEEYLHKCEYYLAELEQKINIKEIKKQFIEARKERNENKAQPGDDRSSQNTKKQTNAYRNKSGNSTFAEFKWMLSVNATLASFYNAIGNQ
mmetsp:Transcript_13265/g.13058  ORF Transcript_13265/g.13058 Transcript_13265/m.13058 type:complete len:152 (+) Transcript_13265:862-1317(+)